MRSTIAIIIVACIVVGICIYLCSRNKKEFWTGIIIGGIIIGCFLAAIVNAASPIITIIKGCDKDSCIKAHYFLFYKAKLTDNKSQIVFLVPYGKGAVQNETDIDLIGIPIQFEDYKHYSPISLPAHSVNKIPDEPSYFFEKVPTNILTYSRSGKTKWLILKKGDEVQYQETHKRMMPY
ncbi:MAG: hypothetical protein J6031_05710 [Bacteroidales bacterium]|nr:hypothetical protein [Bacteroidales bacterium]